HGTAVKAYRETGLTAEIGVVLNMQMAYPYNPEDTGDIEAAGRFHQQANNLFADPILKGCYPQEFFDYLQKQGVVLPAILPGDMELTSQPIDFLGLNTYFASYVRADKTQWPLHGSLCETGRPKTDANWEICPDAMYDLLCWIDKTYDRPKIIITENGTCMNDIINAEGKVEDYRRVDYIKRYLMNVKKAMDEGVNVAGYYVWSFTDNFEWAWGLSRRFGIVYVDYATQQRIPKQSALWFADVIKNNGFEVS
ncbi:MAG: family 1 glycosylhydrolase, partial [Acetanaerobacterium sp.]